MPKEAQGPKPSLPSFQGMIAASFPAGTSKPRISIISGSPTWKAPASHRFLSNIGHYQSRHRTPHPLQSEECAHSLWALLAAVPHLSGGDEGEAKASHLDQHRSLADTSLSVRGVCSGNYFHVCPINSWQSPIDGGKKTSQ